MNGKTTITASCSIPAPTKITGSENTASIVPDNFNPITVERFKIAMYAVNCVAATFGHDTVMYIAKRDAEIMLLISVSSKMYPMTADLFVQSNQGIIPVSGDERPNVA
jgi:hypothetical protein